MSLLVTEKLAGGYGDADVFAEVALEVRRGEIVTVAGTNGSGKSSVIKAIAGLLPRARGSIKLDGVEIIGRPAEDRLQLGIGYVPQVANVFPSLTVLENLKVIPVQGGGPRSSVDWAFSTFPALAERRRNRAGTLSGGERQQLAIARILMAEPQLVILDEPTANLSPALVGQLLEMVCAIPDDRTGVLLVEQRTREALRVSRRGYVMDAGQVVASGEASTLLSDPDLIARFLGQHA